MTHDGGLGRADALSGTLKKQVAALEVEAYVRVQEAVKQLDGLRRDVTDKGVRRKKIPRGAGYSLPVGYDEARHKQARSEIDRLTPVDQRANRVSGAVERAPVLEHDKAQIEATLAATRLAVAELQGQRDALAFDVALHASLREQFDRAEAQVRATELDAVRAGAEAQAGRKALEAARRARSDRMGPRCRRGSRDWSSTGDLHR